MTQIFLLTTNGQQQNNTLITISAVSSSSSSLGAWLSFKELLTLLAQFRVVNEKILKTNTGVMVSVVLAGRQTQFESVLNHDCEYIFLLTLFRQNYTFPPGTFVPRSGTAFEQLSPNQGLHLFSVQFCLLSSKVVVIFWCY